MKDCQGNNGYLSQNFYRPGKKLFVPCKGVSIPCKEVFVPCKEASIPSVLPTKSLASTKLGT